jgi:hypothetical protein
MVNRPSICSVGPADVRASRTMPRSCSGRFLFTLSLEGRRAAPEVAREKL